MKTIIKSNDESNKGNGQDENEFSRYEEEEELGPPGLTSADFNSKSISKSIEDREKEDKLTSGSVEVPVTDKPKRKRRRYNRNKKLKKKVKTSSSKETKKSKSSSKLAMKLIDVVKKLGTKIVEGQTFEKHLLAGMQASLDKLGRSVQKLQKQEKDCFEEIPYDGPTIKFTDPISNAKDQLSSKLKTAKSCQMVCQKEEECNYFTWIGNPTNPATSTCFLKSKKDGNGVDGGGTKYLNSNPNAKLTSKIMSGPKYCVVPCGKTCQTDSDCDEECPICQERRRVQKQEQYHGYYDYPDPTDEGLNRRICTKKATKGFRSNRRRLRRGRLGVRGGSIKGRPQRFRGPFNGRLRGEGRIRGNQGQIRRRQRFLPPVVQPSFEDKYEQQAHESIEYK